MQNNNFIIKLEIKHNNNMMYWADVFYNDIKIGNVRRQSETINLDTNKTGKTRTYVYYNLAFDQTIGQDIFGFPINNNSRKKDGHLNATSLTIPFTEKKIKKYLIEELTKLNSEPILENKLTDHVIGFLSKYGKHYINNDASILEYLQNTDENNANMNYVNLLKNELSKHKDINESVINIRKIVQHAMDGMKYSKLMQVINQESWCTGFWGYCLRYGLPRTLEAFETFFEEVGNIMQNGMDGNYEVEFEWPEQAFNNMMTIKQILINEQNKISN